MKNFIKKLLEICTHETWENVDTFLSENSGLSYVVERCAKCRFVNFHAIKNN